jgi:hypothetical protein
MRGKVESWKLKIGDWRLEATLYLITLFLITYSLMKLFNAFQEHSHR